ncbi:MAG: VTT domain-containing protein [Candidatus Micrarchaeota archaeon]
MRRGNNRILSAIWIGAIILFSIAIFFYADEVATIFGNYSYFGIFAISLISSASVFFPTVPLQIAIFSMGKVLPPLGVGIVAGVASAIGELTGYALGVNSQKLLKTKNKFAKYAIMLQKEAIRRHAGIAIFVFSFFPNPFFDFAGILAGVMKIEWWKFLLYAGAGRILRYSMLAYFGLWATGWI